MKGYAHNSNNRKMPLEVTKYQIFLASPSDLKEERIAVEGVIAELNRTFGRRNNLILELLKWETDSAPGLAIKHTQDLISSDIGTDYDIFIGMLWTKFGTPTLNANSGTEEEFNIAYSKAESSPDAVKLLFYFKNTPRPINEIDTDELKKVETFKREIIKKQVLYGEFDSIADLEQYLRLHIPMRIDDLISATHIQACTVVSFEEENIDEEELGLLDYLEQYNSFLNEATHSLTRISEATAWIGDEITKKADDLARFTKLPNQNPNVLRSLLQRAANAMNDYTQRINTESPIYYVNFETAIEAGIKLLNLVSDFDHEDSIEGLEESRSSIFELKNSIIQSIASMGEFYSAVDELPRIEKSINSARQKMSKELNSLIEKLKASLRLTEEYSKELGNRIDQMKLASGRTI